NHVFLVHEVEERVVAQQHRSAQAAKEGRQGAAPRSAEGVDHPQDRGGDLGGAPEQPAGVEVGGDQVGQLGEAVERAGGLVFGVVERRVGGGAVERVAADEDD